MANKIKKIISYLLIIFSGIVLIGCSSVKSIEIIGKTNVSINGTITLQVSLVPEDADLSKVVWSSSDESVATVNNGVVKGKAVGDVTISASIGKIKADHQVKVVENLNKIIFAGINIESTMLEKNHLFEMSLIERNEGYIKENYNPYNYNEIYVYGVFTSPSGETIQMPAFWYRDYEIILDTNYKGTSGISGVASTNTEEPQGLETVKWLDENSHYRIRIKAIESGKWNYQIYVEESGMISQIIPGSFEITDGDKESKGIIQVDKTNRRGFIYQDGTTYMPIGINLGWWTSSSRKTYDYQVWMEKMALNNMSLARVWMSTWGFALHWGSKYDNFDDRQNSAARLDRLLKLAEENQVYIMLTLINHGQFSSKTNPLWSSNPYNKANGGILDYPEQFFTNVKAKETYKNELLYIIGRYGYSDMIMTWELFNEVNWTDNADLNAVNISNWHKEMADFLKDNDPYHHLVSTSYNYEDGLAYNLPSIDFTNPHNYGYNNKSINATLPAVMERLFKKYNKPILQSEIGINWESGKSTAQLDPSGVTLRQAAWAGMMGGGAGGAMHWWWDSWVHPGNLYYQMKGAGAYAKLVDFTGQDYQQLRLQSGINISNTNLNLLGYKFTNRVYGYVFDKNWTYLTTSNPTYVSQTITMSLLNGQYTLTFYHATTGEVISTNPISVTQGQYIISLPNFTNDIAFIIK